MKRILLTLALLAGSAAATFAQTEGRVSVGASVTMVNPADDEVGSALASGRSYV